MKIECKTTHDSATVTVDKLSYIFNKSNKKETADFVANLENTIADIVAIAGYSVHFEYVYEVKTKIKIK